MSVSAESNDSQAGLTSETPLLDWIGNSREARVQDGLLGQALLNEPNDCYAKLERDEASGEQKFVGLYIVDTGNDCLRFAHPDGRVETLELHGVPDVRITASECVGGGCTVETIMKGERTEEDRKKAISDFWALSAQ